MKNYNKPYLQTDFSSSEYLEFLETKSRQELIDLLMMQKEEKIPVSIFKNKISPLSAIVKYLKEEKNITLAKISRKLNRSSTAIWAAYQKVKDKQLIIKYSSYAIPISYFSNEMSILESVVHYLKTLTSLNYHQIAQLIDRDDRTIWTVHNRAKKKQERK